MGKSSKKSSVEAVPASVPELKSNSNKKGKRVSEQSPEKAFSSKKLKKEEDMVSPRKELKYINNASPPMNPQCSYSDDSLLESSSESIRYTSDSSEEAHVYVKEWAACSWCDILKLGPKTRDTSSDSLESTDSGNESYDGKLCNMQAAPASVQEQNSTKRGKRVSEQSPEKAFSAKKLKKEEEKVCHRQELKNKNNAPPMNPQCSCSDDSLSESSSESICFSDDSSDEAHVYVKKPASKAKKVDKSALRRILVKKRNQQQRRKQKRVQRKKL